MNRPAHVYNFLLCILILSGCASTPTKPEPEVQPQTAPEQAEAATPSVPPLERKSPEFAESRPHVTSRDELTVTCSRNDVELDFRKSYLASEAQLFTAMYEGLFSYHPFTMEPILAAAESWELSDDKRQWTFIIRDDAYYWNGDPVTAEDFRASWLSSLSPERDAPYSSLFDIIEGAKEYRTGILRNANRVGIIASDKKTLVIKLNAPASFFPSMLCHHSFSPIHPSMTNIEDWSAKPPVSNGPFHIAEKVEDKIVFAKSDNYWDAAAVSLNKITLKYTDGEEASSLWNSGEARWLSGEVNLDALTDRSGIQVNAMFATHYYFFRSGEKPWNDYRIRRALVLALPWDEIRAGHYLPAKTLIYPLPGYPEVEGLSGDDDLEEAAALLARAGFPGGAGLPDLVIRITPSMEAARIGGLMANTWKESLGIAVRVEVVPFNRYFQMLKTDGYTVGFSTWIGDFADPYTFLQMWRRDSNLNDAHYDDEDYEALLEKSMLEEGETRWATLADAEQLLLERGAVLPISYSPAINIVDIGELGGWFPNALDIHPFKYLAFKSFRPLPGVVMTGNR